MPSAMSVAPTLSVLGLLINGQQFLVKSPDFGHGNDSESHRRSQYAGEQPLSIRLGLDLVP
jgi:hypothetical protein